MTLVAACTPRVVITGNSTRGPYSLVDASSVAIRLVSTGHLKLTRYSSTTDETGTVLALTTDYTVGGTQDARTFTLSSAQAVLTSSQRIVAERVQSYTQDLDLTTGGAFNATSLESRLDKLAEFQQELKAKVDRAIVASALDTTPSTMPLKVNATSGDLLAFDADKNLTPVTPADIGITSVSLGSGWSTALVLPVPDALSGTGIKPVATYAAMTALVTATGLQDNGVYYTYGRSAEEDGGAGFWRYDSASTTTANGGTVLAADSGTGRFFKLYDETLDLRTFGLTPGVSDAASVITAIDTAYDAQTQKQMLTIPAGIYTSTTGFGNYTQYRSALRAEGEVRMRNTGSGSAFSISDAADYMALGQLRGWPMFEGTASSGKGVDLNGSLQFWIEPNVRGCGTGLDAIKVRFGVAGVLMRPMVSWNQQHPSSQGFYSGATPWNAALFTERSSGESCGHCVQFVPIYEGVDNWGWVELESIGLVTIGGTSEGNGRSATLASNPFATTNGSAVVTVTHTAHGMLTGDIAKFSGAAAVNSITVSGRYWVTVVNANSYTITHSSNASGTGSGGGAAVVAAYGGGWKQDVEAFGARLVDLDFEVNDATDAVVNGASAELRGVHSDSYVWIGQTASDVLIASGDYQDIKIASGATDVTVDKGVRFNRFGSATLTDSGTRTWIDGALDVTNNQRRVKKFAFRGHRNGTNQTSVTTATYTKFAATTEVFDHGGMFDSATNYRWTPALVGIVRAYGKLSISGLSAGTECFAAIYKNGSVLVVGPRYITSGDGVAAPAVDVLDESDGDDYYELFFYAVENSVGSITVNGSATLSYFMGTV